MQATALASEDVADTSAPEGPAPGLVPAVMNHIIAWIRANALKPGQPLPSENALAAELKVSRAVVREATRSLAALGLIDVGNGRRARVGIPDAGVLGLIVDHAVYTEHLSIQQIYDVRRTIELRTAALAALRRSRAEAEAIVAHAAGMRRDFASPERVMEHDIAFHRGIARASRNPMFDLIVGSFAEVTRKTWFVGWTSRPTDVERLDNVTLHEAIAAAILAQDPRAAEAGMAEHFDNSVRALLNAGIG